MKHKNFLKRKFLLTLGFMTVFLFSCHQDDLYQKNQGDNTEMKIKQVSLEDIMQKPEHQKFKGPFSEFKEKITLANNQDNNAKLVYNEDYGMYIDDENGVFIQKEDYVSYTFKISRSESGEKVENIVFTSKSGSNFKPLIVSYDITYEEIENLGQDEITTREIEYSLYEEQSRSWLPSLICIQTWRFAMVPPHEGNNDGGSIDYVGIWVLSGENCSWGGGGVGGGTGGGLGNGGGSGTGTGGGGSGSSGGGGSTTNPPTLTGPDGVIITTPVVYNPHINHVRELKLLTDQRNGNNTPVKEVIDNLKSRLSTDTNEDGWAFNRGMSNSVRATSRGPRHTAYSVDDQSIPNDWHKYFIMIHMHQDRYYKNQPFPDPPALVPTSPVLSDTDIRGALQLFSFTGHNNTTYMLVSRLGTFALRITDTGKAKVAADKLYVPSDQDPRENPFWVKFSDDYDTKVHAPVMGDPDSGEVGDESIGASAMAGFVNTVKVNGQNIGLGLFQAVYDANGNITDWVQL